MHSTEYARCCQHIDIKVFGTIHFSGDSLAMGGGVIRAVDTVAGVVEAD